MPDTKEIISLRTEVGELKDGTLRLAQQVEHLSSTIATVNKMRVEQAKLKKTVAEVQESSATTEDLKVESEERVKVHKTSRNRFILVLLLVFVQIGVVAAIAASYFTYRNQSYDVCLARSDQANRVRTYLEDSRDQALAAATTEAERESIRQGTDRLLAAFPYVDCEGLR